MPKQKTAKDKPAKPTAKEYEDLGRAVAGFYESGYLSKKTTLQMSLLKGIAGGFGGVIGATIVVALLIWVLSFFNEVPLVNKIVKTIDTQNQVQQMKDEQDN